MSDREVLRNESKAQAETKPKVALNQIAFCECGLLQSAA